MVMNTQQKEITIFAPKLNLNHNIYMSTIRAEVREGPEILRHKQDSNNDSCDAGAVLCQWSYHTDWELWAGAMISS